MGAGHRRLTEHSGTCSSSSITRQEQAQARVLPLREDVKPQRRRVRPNGAQSGTDKRRELLGSGARILLERIYQTVPRMRYEMLKNELDYATTRQCRRLVIRGRFDDEAYRPQR